MPGLKLTRVVHVGTRPNSMKIAPLMEALSGVLRLRQLLIITGVLRSHPGV